MRLTILFIMMLFSTHLVRGQIGENLELKQKFYTEVIQIEEFIERFNFEKNTKFQKYVKINYPNLEINREELISQLFDSYNTNLDENLIHEFIDNVNDSANPKYLNFYDDDWYGEVSCIFDYGGQNVRAKLFLKNESGPDMSSKWVIAGITSKLFEYPDSFDTTLYLSPVSHGTDFIGLYNALRDRNNLLNYFIEDFEIDPLTYFIFLVHHNELNIKQVGEVRYHFLQIPDWIFTVEYFNRKGMPSGWLISDLFRASAGDKEIYKRNALHLYLPR